MEGKAIMKDTRKRVTISLPSAEGSEITIVTELNVGQQRRVANAPGDAFDKGIASLVEAVESWNLCGEDMEPLPISKETFERLSQSDLMVLLSAATGKTAEELQEAGEAQVKKNQAASSAA